MADLEHLTGTTFGPFPVTATGERADAFVAAIGGDPNHDPALVHPMFANAALFAAAPAFLDDERVQPFTTSLIHSEQTFEWVAPIPVGARFDVIGTVESVRTRGPLNFVTFVLSAGDWLRGSSVFLMSREAAASADDAGEPGEDERPPFDTGLAPISDAVAGGDVEPVACGASRTDLMRYAEASGDSNPIHYDHDAARRAGLEGVIVHGLLMAAWLGRVANRYGSLSTMKVRFRNPLRPAVPARVTGSVSAVEADALELDLVLSAEDTRLVTAKVAVTR